MWVIGLIWSACHKWPAPCGTTPPPPPGTAAQGTKSQWVLARQQFGPGSRVLGTLRSGLGPTQGPCPMIWPMSLCCLLCLCDCLCTALPLPPPCYYHDSCWGGTTSNTVLGCGLTENTYCFWLSCHTVHVVLQLGISMPLFYTKIWEKNFELHAFT